MNNNVYINKTNQIVLTQFLESISLLLSKIILRFINLLTINIFITTASTLKYLSKAFQSVLALLIELYTLYYVLFNLFKCNFLPIKSLSFHTSKATIIMKSNSLFDNFSTSSYKNLTKFKIDT